jgi:hypothetical protein
MRRITLVFMAALLFPAAAQAKGPIAITVCGESGCKAAGTWSGEHNPFDGTAVASTQAPAPSAYYRLDLELEGSERWSLYYVSIAGALALPDSRGWINWQTLGGSAASAVRRLARELEPFPRPDVSVALLDSQRLRGVPESYLALLDQAGPYTLPEGESVLLELRSSRTSPWTNLSYLYYPDVDVLQRAPGELVRLPGPVAADLEASVAPSSPATDGFTWAWLALGLAGAALVAAGVLCARLLSGRRPRLA